MGLLLNLCTPALIYLVFSLTQIAIDIFKQENNRAFFKAIVMIIFTSLLNILCSRGLGIISWIIVFVPFMLMSFITTILLVVFGLDPASGRIARQRPLYHEKPRHEVEIIDVDIKDMGIKNTENITIKILHLYHNQLMDPHHKKAMRLYHNLKK